MINYLKKYRPNVEIQNNLEGIDVDKIPKFWIEIFENKDFDSKKNYVIKSFKKNHSVVLKNTIMYLVDNLIAVNLINNDNEYSIIYTIKNKLGNHVYYEGKNPKNKIVDDRLLVVWEKLPILLRDFYDNLHNGWYYYASESMGLVNTESIINLSDLEWGILEEITSPLRINLESSYSFFSNGMGSYLVIDTSNLDTQKCCLWSAKQFPKYDLNFWDILDEWIMLGIER